MSAAVAWEAADGLDQETQVRQLVLLEAVRLGLDWPTAHALELFAASRARCAEPSLWRVCQRLPASVRAAVYAAAVRADPSARAFLAQHLDALRDDRRLLASHWLEVEQLLGLLGDAPQGNSTAPPRKCYPVGQSALLRV